ncbi:MAG: hypothetical protein ABI395_04695 [Sphingobium sp.]
MVDPNSQEFQKQLSRELNIARQAALSDTPTVTRVFAVGWDMHHGYYLIQRDAGYAWVIPDLLDQKIVAVFDAEWSADVLDKHAGDRLVCECEGVEWSFYSNPRFIVQKAKLTWQH